MCPVPKLLEEEEEEAVTAVGVVLVVLRWGMRRVMVVTQTKKTAARRMRRIRPSKTPTKNVFGYVLPAMIHLYLCSFSHPPRCSFL
jgi:hypothetical protein